MAPRPAPAHQVACSARPGPRLVQVALGLVFLPPIVAGLTLILQRSSPFIAVYLWAFTFALSLFMMTMQVLPCAVLCSAVQCCGLMVLHTGLACLRMLLKIFPLLPDCSYPTLIAPLFNKFTPLEQGPLRWGITCQPPTNQRIDRLAGGLHAFDLLQRCVPLPLSAPCTCYAPSASREKIEALAASLKFPLRKLFVIDGSKRSAHSNA